MVSPVPHRRVKRERTRRKVIPSREALLAVLESSSEAVVVIDSHDQIVFCNGVAAALWATTPQGLAGRKVENLFGPRFSFLELDAPEGKSFVTEAEALRADGVGFTVRLTLKRTSIGGKPHRALWMCPAWDQRQEMETRSGQRTQQALERLAAGVAHEWNNLLTVVLGNLHLALEEGGGSGRNRANVLDGAYQATLRGREMARGLLAFALGEAPAILPTQVSALAWESALVGLSGTPAKLEADFGPDLWRAVLDAEQAGQAIQQVVAFAAGLTMPGQRIHLTGRNCVLTSPGETLGGRLLPGDYVIISVSAEHLKLRDDDLQHLFYPYLELFGGHTGMRLATARALIARQDGWLQAERTEAGGIAFHFYLPAVPGAGADITPIGEACDSGSGLRVLVMDDEPLVRTVLQRTLESMGHQVTPVSDGAEAAEAYASAMRRGKRFDLAILDLKPGVGPGGVEACERIREVDPLATCVLSSGSVLDDAMTDFHGHGFAGILEKPFETRSLVKLIHELVCGGPSHEGHAHDLHEDLVPLPHDNILAVDFTNPGRRWE